MVSCEEKLKSQPCQPEEVGGKRCLKLAWLIFLYNLKEKHPRNELTASLLSSDRKDRDNEKQEGNNNDNDSKKPPTHERSDKPRDGKNSYQLEAQHVHHSALDGTAEFHHAQQPEADPKQGEDCHRPCDNPAVCGQVENQDAAGIFAARQWIDAVDPGSCKDETPEFKVLRSDLPFELFGFARGKHNGWSIGGDWTLP